MLLAGTTAVFRATGVLDFDVQTTPTSGVHITTSADKPQYYESLPRESAQSAEPRHALIEADGSASQTATPAQASLSATTVAAGDADSAAVADSANAYGQDETATGAGEASTTQTQLFAKSATREMYAEDFDGAHTSIVNLVEEYNGHVVSDARSGDEGARTATLAVDVPSGELDDFLTALDFVAEVTYQSVNSEDISTNYYDAQGRLETLRLEKDRLNELIAQAQDAEELQALDAQLDDVYAQIDTLESKLRSFDSQLAYARVDIVLREGAQLTATAITGQGGTGGAAKQGLSRSLEAIGAFFSDMGVSLAVIAPYAGIAVLLVAIVWVGVVLVGKHRKRD